MKNQALFSSKDKSKKLKCRLLQFLFDALRVNNIYRKEAGAYIRIIHYTYSMSQPVNLQ